MAHTGYNNDYYTSAYVLYLEDPSATDNYIVDDSVYFDTAPSAGETEGGDTGGTPPMYSS